MKINVPKIKIKREKIFKKGGFHTNPNISWVIMVCFMLAVLVGSVIFGLYLFMATEREFDAPAEPYGTGEKIANKERLEKVLEYFSERERKSAQILAAPASVVDPSL